MSAPIQTWLAEPLDSAVRTSLERLAQLDDAVHIAVMPDVHLAHDVCIGTVLATSQTLRPKAIGSDVGCGVATLPLRGIDEATLLPRASDGLEVLASAVPIHRHSRKPAWPNDLEPDALSRPGLRRLARREGHVQLGTIGRGNHFLEVQVDDTGGVWLMAHTGSRALGRAIQALRDGMAPLADSPAGQTYLHDLKWAEAYAVHNRQRVLGAAIGALRRIWPALRPDPEQYLDCAHNTVRCECHFDQPLWVHRKGAISARAGEPGLIPGSMGTASFHVEGRGHPGALASSSHGAGRAMSRTAARQRLSGPDERRRLAQVAYHDGPALLEESPGAYRDIGKVMRAQRELTRIVRRLRPRIVHKG
ncbi:MAG: RtcB family protein [Myxococcota bacterium]